MAMGREFLPPEEADSWGEFHARLEFEAADPGPLLIPVWWTVGGLLFGVDAWLNHLQRGSPRL
jgi:hypothetical protein